MTPITPERQRERAIRNGIPKFTDEEVARMRNLLQGRTLWDLVFPTNRRSTIAKTSVETKFELLMRRTTMTKNPSGSVKTAALQFSPATMTRKDEEDDEVPVVMGTKASPWGTPEADYWWKELRPTWWRRKGRWRMGHRIDMYLDVLASGPDEINAIENALKNPCAELIEWRAQMFGMEPKDIAEDIKEIVTFSPICNLGSAYPSGNKARRFKNAWKSMFRGLVFSHIKFVSQEFANAVFLAEYYDGQASSGERL